MGEVTAIHIASAVWPQPVRSVDEVEAVAGRGLVGDRKFDAYRQISIVSTEELEEAAIEWGGEIQPGSTRRQVTITGTKLNRTPGTTIKLGDVVVTVNGDCSPCAEMNESVGPGAQEALRQRAGITGTIEKGGTIRRGDPVELG